MKPSIIIFSMLWLLSCGAWGQALDIEELDTAISQADHLIRGSDKPSFRNVESFLVYYDGQLRFEGYYHDFGRDSLHILQSQTKSVVALLMGIAIDLGFVASEEEPFIDHFPEYQASADSLKKSVRIRDLLTMSAGFDWEEMLLPTDPLNDNINMWRSHDYLGYILPKQVIYPPSTVFKYNSGCPMLVAAIIERSSGMPLDEFATKYLFEPLGIERFRWGTDTTGFFHAGGGLHLRTSDMLKIGIMVMNGGSWEGKQVVSADWIRKIAEPTLPTGFDTSRYGFFWWIRDFKVAEDGSTVVLSAEGAGGQKMYILPDYGLIVAFNEHNYNYPPVGPIFLRESIIPILR